MYMSYELVKTFRFEAAHSLSHLPAGHKCRNMHGHSYRVDIHVTGQPDDKLGWVVDFGDIKSAVAPVIDQLDHKNLNEIPGLEISTSEMICKYIYDKVKPLVPGLSAVTIWESDTSKCKYQP